MLRHLAVDLVMLLPQLGECRGNVISGFRQAHETLAKHDGRDESQSELWDVLFSYCVWPLASPQKGDN